MRLYLADFDAPFHDIRSDTPEHLPLHDPHSYTASQAFAQELLASGANGVIYRSVRRAGSECLVHGLYHDHRHDVGRQKSLEGVLRDHADLRPPQLRFHDLRHSAATLLLIQGVHPKVVQELGGWSDIRIVLNTYSHVIPSLKDEAASKMNSILNPVAYPSNTAVVN